MSSTNENEESEENETSESKTRIPLDQLTEADEVYERMEELTIEVNKAKQRVDEIANQLKQMREGIGDLNDLMDVKALHDVVIGRHMILEHALKASKTKLESISNSTRSMLVKALASLRTVLFHKLRAKQKQYDATRSERIKRERDETERRMISTTESLKLERKSQSMPDSQLLLDFQERVEWLVNGDTKKSLSDLTNSYFITPRALDETARIERFLAAHRQQGTGAKLILLLKHMQLNENGVYAMNVSHNPSIGNWSNLLITSLGHELTCLHTLHLRNCHLDDDVVDCFIQYLPKNQTLTDLDVSKNLITNKGIGILGNCLPGCLSLIKLNISDNNLTHDGNNHKGIDLLCQGAGSTKNIVNFQCSNADIYSDGTKRLMTLNWKYLLDVNLSYNYLTNRGGITIGRDMLPLCECLHTLRLVECFISDVGFLHLMHGVWGHPIEVSKRDDEELSIATLLTTTIEPTKPIESIESKENQNEQNKETSEKRDIQIRRTDPARRPRKWKLIDLSGNRITDSGIQDYNVQMKTITNIYQRKQNRSNRKKRNKKNNRETYGAEPISTFLYDYEREAKENLDQYRSHVQVFRLTENALTETGARTLGNMFVTYGAFIKKITLESLLDRKSVQGHLDICHIMYSTTVNMNGQGMSELSVVTASELLRSNRKVVEISLRGNCLGTHAASLFAQGLAVKNNMECLNKIDFSYNLIKLSDLKYAAKFFRGLAMIETIRELMLDSNEMRDDALWGVASFLASNPSIRVLSLRDQDFKRRKTLQNLFQNLKFNNKLILLDLRYNPSVLKDYIFQAESFQMVAKELEESNAGLRVLPFHEDPDEIIPAPRRRLPDRKDLYPTIRNNFTYDDMHRQIRARVDRMDEKMKERGSLHVRYHKEGTLVV